jgi:mono/diheme cytochrome c family protein
MDNSRTPLTLVRLRWLGVVLVVLLVTLLAWMFWPAPTTRVAERHDGAALQPAPGLALERGRYLSVLGNCQGCHSLPGQAPYAGGTPIATPFGTVFGPNLTPSKQGLGNWSAGDFWRALHHGQAPDGRWLNPAFPYTHTTHVTRDDSDAIFGYLQSLPADDTPNRPSELRWPYNTQAALKVWRTLYFTPGSPTAEAPPVGDGLGRGRYLVEGLAHCSACHSPRDRLGGLVQAQGLSGGAMTSGWYAPSLLDPQEAGVQGWALDAVVSLLRDGKSGHHATVGPMAEVVVQSLRHWEDADLRAVAQYLIALPAQSKAVRGPVNHAKTHLAVGRRVYEQHCASCHGDQGQGFTLNDGWVAYPSLVGNRAVTLDSPANLLRTVQEGGFGLPTAQHPQPFGMPPFQLVLNDNDMAAVLTYIRQSWGNQGATVQPLDVHQLNNRHAD